MENRIDTKLSEIKKKEQKAVITFITAGYPSLDETVDLVLAMEEAGADIIELGIPYSDPLADGVIIQEASTIALTNGAKICKIMDKVKSIRVKSQIPLVYMVYYNSIFKYGMERFIKEAKEVGIDGVIIPDLPIEERKDILEIANKYSIYLIPLVAPTSKERIKSITDGAKGFIYCVSTMGVTGVRNKISTNIEEYMETVGSYTEKPKALGFGISNAKMAAEFKAYCDGVIIGSAIIKKVMESANKEDAIENVRNFVSEISKVCKE